MFEGRKPMYALVVNGEWDVLDENESEILSRAKTWVMEKIGDRYRHAIPLRVTPEIAHDMDTYVYKLADVNRVELPLQAWFDEYHAEVEQCKVEGEEREWKRYLELREKFKDRPVE
jgi:hypothetical protein